MLDQVQVRQSTESDSAAVKELYEASLADISGKRGEAAILSGAPDLDSSAVEVLVVTVAEVVMGFATYNNSSTELVVSWLYITPQARKIGLGAALLNHILALAGANKASRISSVALPGDAKTKNFFESFGMKASLLTIGREL